MKVNILRLVLLSAIAFLFISCSEDQGSKPLPVIIAHRGLPLSFPENSKEGFDAVVSLGIDAVETDVYMTKDDSVFIIHDVELSRLTDLTGNVQDFTAQELREAVSRKTGGTSLTVAQFLERYKGKFQKIYFDVKEGQNEVIIATALQIEGIVHFHTMENIVIATSTSEAPLDTLLKVNPSFQTAIEIGDANLFSDKVKKHSRVLLNHGSLTRAISEMSKASNAELIIFTPNTSVEFQNVIDIGCDAIMTDNPVLLQKYLDTL
ncbi:MAG: glycerophosphodiester phosphodiesterase family protein [Bacteroidota bacterium]|nr:glycerophosphodiester phosphodiesterase family protein [Bacteroidota bacterium]